MSDKEQTIEVLRYARDVVLADESYWVQAAYNRNLIGKSQNCTIGAVQSARCLAFPVRWPAVPLKPIYRALAIALDEVAVCDAESAVVTFNDTFGRTYSDVIDLFDKAVKLLEEDA